MQRHPRVRENTFAQRQDGEIGVDSPIERESRDWGTPQKKIQETREDRVRID